jgi:integrase
VSLYKFKGSPYWQYDFQVNGCRFHGSTKTTNKREAEAIEKAEKERAKREVVAETKARTSLRLDDVCGRYWQEVGQHHAGEGAPNTFRQLDRLVDYFGPDKLLTEITDSDVAGLVARRRADKTQTGKLISNYTTNDTTQQLKKLFTRARTAWGVNFDRLPNWRAHMLAEPSERVRELVGDEGERLEDAARDDYLPLFQFARATGLRLSECVTLKWSEVDRTARRIRKAGKGGRLVTTPITDAVNAILLPLEGHHVTHVFTYVAERTREGRAKGERYPLTVSGVKTAWRRLRKRAGVEGFRFHDYRHDVGTKLLRETGNLKLVQRALNHRDLKTTSRYAHVLDGEVEDALNRLNNKSQTKSQSDTRKAS